MGGAGAKASKNVRSTTSIFKSINLLGAGAGETVIPGSRVGISSELRSFI